MAYHGSPNVASPPLHAMIESNVLVWCETEIEIGERKYVDSWQQRLRVSLHQVCDQDGFASTREDRACVCHSVPLAAQVQCCIESDCQGASRTIRTHVRERLRLSGQDPPRRVRGLDQSLRLLPLSYRIFR